MTGAFDRAVSAIRAGLKDADAAAAELVGEMTEGERLWVLDGDAPFWRGVLKMARAYNTEPIVAGAVPRLGVPGLRFSDGPRGVVMGNSTAFPAVIARAATWDPALEEQIGRAAGAEARAQGANLFGGVCADLARHPGWGRTQESYGEDPVLVGSMAAALARGAAQHVMPCVKHFVLNAAEDARFVVDVRVDEATLHDVYLAPFRTVVESGVQAVGTAYNQVNGTPVGQSRQLLTEVLREEWGFDGFVMTDFLWGLRDPIGSLAAGQDLEMPFRQQRARALPQALRDGRLDPRDVERCARRLVRTQLRHAASLGPSPDPAVIAGPKHRALAREAAAQSIVLLQNEPGPDGIPLLPLGTRSRRRVAVIGELATAANFGDAGSSAVRPRSISTVFDGLRDALGPDAVVHHDGKDPRAAAAVAAGADTAVVVVGLRSEDEGEGIVLSDAETLALAGPPFTRPRVARMAARLLRAIWPRVYSGGGDRRDLRMRPEDEELVHAVAAANERTAVVVIGGSTILMETWRHDVATILVAWYPGMEGGRGVADVLLGDREPGGRLPFAIPTDAAHLPHFDPDARQAVYDRWIGQRKLDRDGHRAAYPLGFGLGYTTFAITDLELDTAGEEVRATVRVRNMGARRGATVVQLYAFDAHAPEDRRVDRLVGFARVAAEAGEARDVKIALNLRPLCERNPAARTWSLIDADWLVRASQHANDSDGPVHRLPGCEPLATDLRSATR